MKFLDILMTAASNLWKNKVRTILTILAVFVGAFAISLTVGMNIGVNSFITTEIGGLGMKNIVLVSPKQDAAANPNEPQKYTGGNAAANSMSGYSYRQTGNLLNKNDIDKLKKLPNVSDVQHSQNPVFDYIQGSNGNKYRLSVSVVEPSLNIVIKAGRQVGLHDAGNEITISEKYVKSLGFSSDSDAVGKTVTLQYSAADGKSETVTATIVGVSQVNALVGGSDGWLNQTFSTKVASFNSQGLPASIIDGYSNLQVTTADNADAEKVKNDIVKAGYSAETFSDSIKTITNVTTGITGALVLFGVITLLAATFGIVNTLYMSVQDRTREIGLMKALGLSRGKVFTIFSLEATLIGFFGSLLGLLLAMLAGMGINSLATNSFLSGLPNFHLIEFQFGPSLIIILIIMLIAFAAGTLPARKASKLDPITALRTE